ncbi:MAG: flagellar biosynthetic protein FliO [Parachlamydiaceae bacterium]|nr:flagellar biosynthetic protein FliO [Parachlamydiaceae bacterium]
MKIIFRFFLTFFLLLTHHVIADEMTKQSSSNHYEVVENSELDSNFQDSDSDNQPDSFQAKFRKMLTLLALIIAFMIIAAWSLKKLMKTKLVKLNTDSAIKVIETRSLSPKSTLYLVEIEDQTILIAETGSSVTHLSTISNHKGQI